MLEHCAYAIDGEPNNILIVISSSQKQMIFNCSPTEYVRGLAAYHDGDLLIQDAFPFLADDEREFLITGLMPDEFDDIFEDEDTFGDHVVLQGGWA